MPNDERVYSTMLYIEYIDSLHKKAYRLMLGYNIARVYI